MKGGEFSRRKELIGVFSLRRIKAEKGPLNPSVGRAPSDSSAGARDGSFRCQGVLAILYRRFFEI